MAGARLEVHKQASIRIACARECFRERLAEADDVALLLLLGPHRQIGLRLRVDAAACARNKDAL